MLQEPPPLGQETGRGQEVQSRAESLFRSKMGHMTASMATSNTSPGTTREEPETVFCHLVFAILMQDQ